MREGAVELSAAVLWEEAVDAAAATVGGRFPAAEVERAGIIDRGTRGIEALRLLPAGWTVLREFTPATYRRGSITTFSARDGDGARGLRARTSRCSDLHPSVSEEIHFSECNADEARGRAVLLLLAAIDAEGRG